MDGIVFMSIEKTSNLRAVVHSSTYVFLIPKPSNFALVILKQNLFLLMLCMLYLDNILADCKQFWNRIADPFENGHFQINHLANILYNGSFLSNYTSLFIHNPMARTRH